MVAERSPGLQWGLCPPPGFYSRNISSAKRPRAFLPGAPWTPAQTLFPDFPSLCASGSPLSLLFFRGRSIGMGIYYVSSLSFSWVLQPHVCIQLVAFKVSSFSCFVPVFIFKKNYHLLLFFFPSTFWLWKRCPFIVFLYFSSVMAQVFCLVTSWHLLFYDIVVLMISLLSLHVHCVRSHGVSRLGTWTSLPWLGSWGSSC